MQKKYKKLFIIAIILNLSIFNVWCSGCPKQEDMPKGYPYSEYCCNKCQDILADKSLVSVKDRIRSWSKYKKECKQHGEYERYKAELYGSNGDYDKTIEILEESMKNPNYNIVDNAETVGFFMYLKGNFKRLKAIAELLVNKYPQYSNGYTLMGLYYISTEEWDLAKINLEKAYELKLPNQAEFIAAYLSSVYYEFDRYEDARRLYCEASRTDPKNILRQRRPTATMIASLVYMNRLDDAKQLMTAFEKANPDLKSCEYYDTLQNLISEAEKEASLKTP